MPGILRSMLVNSPKIVILLVLLSIPELVTNLYVLQVMTFVGIYVILALSLNLLNGYLGLLSIGHAAFYGLGAYASAKLVMELKLPFLLSMLGAGAVAGAFGYLIAKPTLRLSGIYMTLATLGFNIVLFLLLQNWMGFTNGPLGIMDIPPPVIFGLLVQSRKAYYYFMLVLVVLTVWSMRRLVDSRFGRALVAIRENELAAEATGVFTTRYKVQGFVLAAFYAGVAGSFYAHFVRFISPDSFYINESFILLAMLALGGQGNLAGPIVGAAALVVIPEVFRFLQEYRMFVYGGILIVMMLFRRQGILGDRDYTLQLPWFKEGPKVVYARGDKFLPDDEFSSSGA